MSAAPNDDTSILDPELAAAETPPGVDRRTFLMRSAMIGAVTVLSGCEAPSAKATAEQAASAPPTPRASQAYCLTAQQSVTETASPPSDVSLYFAFISFAVSAIAATVVSKSTRRCTGISLLAMAKPVHAFTAP